MPSGRYAFACRTVVPCLMILMVCLSHDPAAAQLCLHDGDVTQDRILSPADALRAFEHFLSRATPPLDACQLARTNVLDPDGSGITPGDALCIFRRFLALPSCLDTRPVRLVVRANAGQLVGTSQPLIAVVADAGGRAVAVAGVPISFAIVSGPGTLFVSQVPTDANGEAPTLLTLGTLAVPTVMNASTEGLPPVTVTITPVTSTQAQLLVPALEVMGNTAAQPGEDLPAPLVVRVEDEFGNPVAGVEVQVEISAGNAAVRTAPGAEAQVLLRAVLPAQEEPTIAVAVTDAQGEARFLVRVNAVAEDIVARVSIPALNQTREVLLVSNGLVFRNAAPVIVSPGPQFSVEGETRDLQMQATDADGEPLIFAVVNLPPGLSIDAATGRITGTVAVTAAVGSPYATTITVSDGTATASVFFLWTVTTEPVVPTLGNIEGLVIDFTTRLGISGVELAFADSNEGIVGSTQSDDGGFYALALPVGRIRGTASQEGFIATTVDVDVVANTVTTVETLALVPDTGLPTGDIGGTVRDALTGASLSGVTVDLRSGVNNTTGDIMASTTTDSDGSYTFVGLPVGTYTALFSRGGFRPNTSTVGVVGGTLTGGQDGTLSPPPIPGEVRIVLTWGATPEDLDAHLTGPKPAGTPDSFSDPSCSSDPERFHLFFLCAGNFSPFPDDFTLDLDDVTSFGPETITLRRRLEGIYRYSVHDFTNSFFDESTALSNSGAQVRVFIEGSEPLTFNIPPDMPGTVWTVFELDGATGTITPINAFGFESASDNIASF